jgi:hypothetical protein
MKDEMLDRILANEEELVPSSGFAASVMDRILEEIAAPPFTSFPWRRAVPGIVLAVGVLGWSAFELTRRTLAPAHSGSAASIHLSVQALHSVEGIGWVAIGLGLSLASWTFARLMTGAPRMP